MIDDYFYYCLIFLNFKEYFLSVCKGETIVNI